MIFLLIIFEVEFLNTARIRYKTSSIFNVKEIATEIFEIASFCVFCLKKTGFCFFFLTQGSLNKSNGILNAEKKQEFKLGKCFAYWRFK